QWWSRVQAAKILCRNASTGQYRGFNDLIKLSVCPSLSTGYACPLIKFISWIHCSATTKSVSCSVVWAWDFHVGGLKFETPCQRKQGVLPSGSSSSHRACLVCVTSPIWFASYCIGAGVLRCAHRKGSDCGFPSSSKKEKVLQLPFSQKEFEPFGVAQWFELGTSMLEVSSSKPLASESKGFAFWVELVAPGLPSAGYLSYVVCELLHRSGGFTLCAPKG
ncbi:hypothetical protein MTR67_040479, partial [Solanum verrucosum]